ncbi:MAG: DUF177 domain-containing protein [Clostridia bacterium]|nr:DUF177 domain-containing protein [Clostridia bacterium]
MKLDLRELLAGTVKEVPFSFDFTAPQEQDLFGTLQSVRFTAPLAVEGAVTNAAGYIRLTLSLSADYVAPCARCLRDVSGSFSLPLEKTVVSAEQAQNMDEDTLDDYLVAADGFLCLEDPLLDLLYMEFPQKILCDEDCKGLCSICGQNLNEKECNCKPAPDPRLAPLQAMLDELRAKESQNQN